MIESRRAPSATGPSTCSPPLSGPRWTSDALIAASRSASAAPSATRFHRSRTCGRTLWASRHRRLPAAPLRRTRPRRACGARRARRGRTASRARRVSSTSSKLKNARTCGWHAASADRGAAAAAPGASGDRPSGRSRGRRSARASARRDVRLEAVLEVPDVLRVAEAVAQRRAQSRVVALADEADAGAPRPAPRRRFAGTGCGRTRRRADALRPLARYCAATARRNASGACADAVESRTVRPRPVQRVVAACEQRLVLRSGVPLQYVGEFASFQTTIARASGTSASTRCAYPQNRPLRPSVVGVSRAKPKTASTTRRLAAPPASARCSSSSRAPRGRASPCHGTQTRTASAPSCTLPAHDARAGCAST